MINVIVEKEILVVGWSSLHTVAEWYLDQEYIKTNTQLVPEIKIEKGLDLSKSEILNVTNKHPIGNDAKLIIENRFLVNYPKTSIMSL